MALSSDEERILIEIERHLGHDDPRFARKLTAAQRHMRLRHVLPVHRLFLLLAVAGIIAFVSLIASTTTESTDSTERPSQEISADQRDFRVLEPR
jgi:DUF3040 family protein